MSGRYLTPCPYCGLHSHTSVRTWVCGACLETGKVTIEDFMEKIESLIQKEKYEKALGYMKEVEEVDPPLTAGLSHEALREIVP